MAAEYVRLRQLGGHLAPRPLFCGRPPFLLSSLLVMEFVPGRHRSYRGMRGADVKRLAAVLAGLHASTAPSFNPSAGQPARAGTLLDYARNQVRLWIEDPLGRLPASFCPEARPLIARSLERLERLLAEAGEDFRGQEFSLLHGDPGPKNVIWSGERITLIDWTESGYGDPADELAFLFATNRVSRKFRTAFLAEYGRHRHGPPLEGRLGAYELKNLIADLAWAMGQLHAESEGGKAELLSKGEEAYRGHYEARLEALRGYLGTKVPQAGASKRMGAGKVPSKEGGR